MHYMEWYINPIITYQHFQPQRVLPFKIQIDGCIAESNSRRLQTNCLLLYKQFGQIDDMRGVSGAFDIWVSIKDITIRTIKYLWW